MTATSRKIAATTTPRPAAALIAVAGPRSTTAACRARTPRVPTAALLIGAIVLEVAGTTFLQLSNGLTRPVFVLAVMACYGVSIALFGRVLSRGMTLGIAYGLLTASGLIAATTLSVLVFGQLLTPLQAVGLIALGCGAWLLQTGGRR